MLNFNEDTIQEKAKLTIGNGVYCLEQNSDKFIRLTSDNLNTNYCLIYAFDVHDVTQIYEVNDDDTLTYLDEFNGWENVEEIDENHSYHYETLIEYIFHNID